MSKAIKQAPAREVMRSQINFASYNPRKLSEDARKRLKANLKRIGLAGGIVWNEATGNLVSGHQRLSILDEIQKFNPDTKDNDYPIRVEVLRLTEKEEKEQNIFMNSSTAQGEFDSDLLAAMLPDIDIDLAGLDSSDISIMMAEAPTFDIDSYHQASSQGFREVAPVSEAERQARIDHVKEVRAQVSQGMEDEYYEGEAYVTLSFQNYANKLYFMEAIAHLLPNQGILPSDKYIKGEPVHELIEH
ncbi:hypothetical protein HMPREF9134_00511 [Porphyromonas catoniae F0037]|uniref:ParB/Sulfiredoxin domain-containing protein n=1 Tax=Porphyromonas catoniae F0037 TaxID=1127696 RepID=L1NFR2_9PORP|nr:hypothetical protein [Porphyromonas catoniae]EKY02125.1 hypothetical protein HMPREF9134_00511 [Porphyromonas catoniae F0037]